MKRSTQTVHPTERPNQGESFLKEIIELETAVIRSLPEASDEVLQAYFNSELPIDECVPAVDLPDYRPLLVGMNEEEFHYHASNFQALDNSIQKVRELLALVRNCSVDSLMEK